MKSGIDDQVQYIVFNFRFRVSGELNIKITIIVIATAAAMQCNQNFAIRHRFFFCLKNCISNLEKFFISLMNPWYLVIWNPQLSHYFDFYIKQCNIIVIHLGKGSSEG